MTEPEFENYVRSIGYENVAMDGEIELRNGVDIILEFLNDTRNTDIVKLRDVYRQLKLIQGVHE